jgi:hypothetical protein
MAYSLPKHDPSPEVVTYQSAHGGTRTWSHGKIDLNVFIITFSYQTLKLN